MTTENVTSTRMLSADEAATVEEAAAGIYLPDYDLQGRIGAGGYGEVWRAIGPGGLPKAVKVLYGERTGQHAEAELKALERMRELRHPFLLSIERIEVVSSRLVVVTELADGNLFERFEQCQQSGMPGIPRDELLGYLRDAADALDYMAEQHGLQHLDIKPDNLLIQGGHAKVGDFGLAKDINSANVSIVNGFTPMFAAPELFEGSPGRGSDQYSLAIVYQYMLTGSLPFNGRTAAQLTAQHLRSQPDLSNLQPIDRPVIARALSKNMNSRFESCRQLIDELIRRKPSRSINRSDVKPAAQVKVGHITTQVKSQDVATDGRKPETESVPVNCRPVPEGSVARRHSVLIGTGGLAGNILRQVRQFAAAGRQNCPVTFLQVDSDRAALAAIKSDDTSHGFTADEMLAIPLRSSGEYRAARGLDLSWMSRRWLFNIPRSGQVEGIRPLGRLALFDHRNRIYSRLESLLTTASDNCPANTGVDVYVVAATFGGTGSGTVSDIGLMAQRVIREKCLRNVTVNAVLVHGSGTTRNVNEVQKANTVSTLRELQHLLTPGLDTRRGFDNSPAMRSSTPFTNSYFIHMGDGLNDSAFGKRVSDVARYLATAVLTDAQLDFHTWRTTIADTPEVPTQLRLLGISSQDAVSLKTASQESGNLCSLLLQRWCRAPGSESSETHRTLPAELADTQTLLTQISLTDDTVPQQVMSLIRGECSKNIETCASRIIRNLRADQAVATLTRGQVLNDLSAQLASRDSGDGPTLYGIISDIQATVSHLTTTCTTALDRHFRTILDTPHRIEGAIIAVDYIQKALTRCQATCASQLQDVESMFRDLTETEDTNAAFACSESGSPDESLDALCRQYCVLLGYRAIYQCFRGHLSAVAKSVDEWTGRLEKMRRALMSVASACVGADFQPASVPQPVVDAFDRQLRCWHATLLAEFSADPAATDEFRERLQTAATNFMVAATGTSSGTQTPANGQTAVFPQNAWPSIRNVGGRRRVLGLIPQNVSETEWKNTLEAEFGQCVATRLLTSDCVSVVCEVEGVPVQAALSQLTLNNPHISDLASRIHTRIDVDW